MSVGQKVQSLRKKQGWSQGDLAMKIDVTRQTVSKWELDETLPDTENVLKLCTLFQIPTDDLLMHAIGVNNALNPEKQSSHNRLLQKRFLQCSVIFLVLGILTTGVLLTLSQIVPSRMKVVSSYTADDVITLGEGEPAEKGRTVHSYIKTTGFLPFLNTYYLHWLFFAGCVLLGLSIYCFIRFNKIKKQYMFE